MPDFSNLHLLRPGWLWALMPAVGLWLFMLLEQSGRRRWQAVAVSVEVVVLTWFTGAPAFPEVEVENALVLSPEGAVNFVVQSGGKTFAAQSRRYLIYPRAEGIFTVPSMKVGVTYALPDGRASPPVLPASPSIRFEARMPPGAEKAKYFLTTQSFQIIESLDRKPVDLEVGSSITRTVTMSARDTVGISLPPLDFEAPEGIRLYPGTPKITETTERGVIQASRTETTVYVPEREGQYLLPEIEVLWWNPRTKTMNRASLPAIELKVQASSVGRPEQFASSQADETPPGEASGRLGKGLSAALRWALTLVAVSILFFIMRRVFAMKGVSIRFCLSRMHRRRAEAETTHFKQFRKASLANDPQASLRHLMLWLDCANPGPFPPILRQFAAQSLIPELAEATSELNDFLFARQTNTEQTGARRKWSGTRLYNFVAKARKLQKKRGKQHHRETPLMDDIN